MNSRHQLIWSEAKVILVFTSVKDDRPWYKRDILNVCCERKGANIQFAYKTDWIAKNVRSSDRLKGKEALVVFCERKQSSTTDQYSSGYFSFHPVRKAVVTDANPEFATTTITLSLGDFFDYEGYRGQIPTIISKFQRYVIDSPANPNNPKHSEARFVRDEVPWDEAKFAERWMPLVQYIGQLDGVDDSVFFCAQKRGEFGGPPVPIFPTVRLESGRTTYELKSGLSYEVSLQLIAGAKANYQNPEFSVKGSLASVAGPFVRQRSAGLQADFVVQSKRSFEQEACMLSIIVPPLDPGTFRSPEINALMKLSVRRGILILAVVLLTAGGFFVSMSPDSVKEFGTLLSGSFSNWVAEHKNWISGISKFFGLAMLASGSYIGFRKLPYKTD
jgi:hypothetical protein